MLDLAQNPMITVAVLDLKQIAKTTSEHHSVLFSLYLRGRLPFLRSSRSVFPSCLFLLLSIVFFQPALLRKRAYWLFGLRNSVSSSSLLCYVRAKVTQETSLVPKSVCVDPNNSNQRSGLEHIQVIDQESSRPAFGPVERQYVPLNHTPCRPPMQQERR